MTLGINDIQYKTLYHYAGYCYAECHVLFAVMLSVVLLNVDCHGTICKTHCFRKPKMSMASTRFSISLFESWRPLERRLIKLVRRTTTFLTILWDIYCFLLFMLQKSVSQAMPLFFLAIFSYSKDTFKAKTISISFFFISHLFTAITFYISQYSYYWRQLLIFLQLAVVIKNVIFKVCLIMHSLPLNQWNRVL